MASDEAWFEIAKRRARQLGVTQDDLAIAMGGITRGAVGHYLSGRREPDIAGLKAIARRLRMSVSELIGEVVEGSESDPRDEIIARLERELADLREAAAPIVAAVQRHRGAAGDA